MEKDKKIAFADEIFVARPVHYRWSGNLPTSYVGIEDLKTKVGFKGRMPDNSIRSI